MSTSRGFILEALCAAGMIDLDGDKGDSYLMHPGTSHDVETYPIAEELLQGIMNRDRLKFAVRRKGKEMYVCS